jgi:NAD(P)-dependent dehydrogenase (short-subunit alcohol dehydrogenase family)
MANEPVDGEKGVIVCTASAAAFDGTAGQAAYAASKAGVVGMTLPLARDLAPYGIRIATIAPGMFDTPILQRLPEHARAEISEAIPNPARPGRPSEFARLALEILENGYVNGTTYRLDAALRLG